VSERTGNSRRGRRRGPAGDALERTLDLLRPDRRPARPDVSRGYLDLLGRDNATGPHPGQQLMASRVLPLIYERLWRPLGGRLLLGPGVRDEQAFALKMLELSRGDWVLDVGCGPGNFTRVFAEHAPDGLVVGIDASETMLARAAQEPQLEQLAYVRGDASALPFGDETFDAVCCFAALYLIEHPLRALAEIARVLAPGGRVALLASSNRGPLPAALTNSIVRPLSGVRIFDRDDLTGALRELGLRRIEQRVDGFGQFVSARKPSA
jgi:ubiquinone/menaquinone biosynthesis C-methylase UbiE